MYPYQCTHSFRNQVASSRQAWAENTDTSQSTDTSYSVPPYSAAGDYAGSASARGQTDYDDVSQAGDQHHCMDIDEPGSSIRQSQLLENTVKLFEALDNLKPLVGRSREEINRVTARLGHEKDDVASMGSNVQARKAMKELKDNCEKMGRENTELKVKLYEKDDYQRLDMSYKDRLSDTKDTAKISSLEEELRKATDTNESINTKYKEVYLKYKQANDRIEELGEVVEHGKRDLASMAQECESLRTTLSGSCMKWEDGTKKMEVELSDYKTRLSSLLGSKVTDNNPAIADLSDQNRPTKLAEKYLELYDYQWTDAFEVLVQRSNDEQKSIGVLVQLLQDIKRHCDNMAEDQVNKLLEAITLGRTRDECSDHVFKQLKDFRKIIARSSFPEVFQKYLANNRYNANASLVSDERVQPFVKECVELCWLMSVQDPPLTFGPTPEYMDNFNTNTYKFYTKARPTVSYVVWPALHLYERGPMLSKGIAQGCGTSESKSTKGSSRDSSRIKSSVSDSSSGGPQRAPSMQAKDHNVKGIEHEVAYTEYDNGSPVHYKQNVQHQHKNDQHSALRDTNPTTGTSQGGRKTAKETESKHFTARLNESNDGSQRPSSNETYELPDSTGTFLMTQFQEYVRIHGVYNYETRKEFGKNYEKCLAYYRRFRRS